MDGETLDPVRQIADAVLYEGYLLWPYRRSAMKNRQRWTFGGVFPRGHHEVHHDDRCEMVSECLLEGGQDAGVEVRVRFLHVVRRQVMAPRPGGSGLVPVEDLSVGDERHLSWEEATEREVVAELPPGRETVRVPIDFPAGQTQEDLCDPAGTPMGAIVRSWKGLEGALELHAQPLGDGLVRVGVRVTNDTPWSGGPREEALKRAFCSTHAVLRAQKAEFVSLTDPPEELRQQAEACRNEGVWPVLVGEPEERHTLLASPIILEDHPRIAPESPGDLFDGGEIDQMLILNMLSMTDEEKAEMRQSDPKAREILDRSEALTNEELMSLHGAIREFQHVRP
ncbi:MAG: hypothetical protein ACR2HC_03540 [Thermoleophilaceae bacterium]